MKKILTLALAAMMILQLAGCGRFTLERSTYDAENGVFVNETTD